MDDVNTKRERDDPATEIPATSETGRRTWWRWLKFVVIPVAILYLGDFGYSRYANWKHDQWEQTIQRDANGVMQDCDAFTIASAPDDGDRNHDSDNDVNSGTAILLLHGINETPFTYQRMGNALSQKGFHVRAMRMPGFGEPIEVYGSTTADDWIGAVEDEARKLRSNHDRVFIVAHSLGGAVTIQTLLRAGDKQDDLFDGLILLAPAIEVSSRRSPILKTQTWHSISSVLLFTRFTYSPFQPDTQDPELLDFPNRIPVTPRSVINETFRLIDSNRNREAEITLPVLLVLSERDQVNDHEASQNWFDKIGSERKQLIWNNRSGHQLPCDFGWDDIVAEIVRFTKP